MVQSWCGGIIIHQVKSYCGIYSDTNFVVPIHPRYSYPDSIDITCKLYVDPHHESAAANTDFSWQCPLYRNCCQYTHIGIKKATTHKKENFLVSSFFLKYKFNLVSEWCRV